MIVKGLRLEARAAVVLLNVVGKLVAFVIGYRFDRWLRIIFGNGASGYCNSTRSSSGGNRRTLQKTAPFSVDEFWCFSFIVWLIVHSFHLLYSIFCILCVFRLCALTLHAQQLCFEIEETLAEETHRAIKVCRSCILHIAKKLLHPRRQMISKEGALGA